ERHPPLEPATDGADRDHAQQERALELREPWRQLLARRRGAAFVEIDLDARLHLVPVLYVERPLGRAPELPLEAPPRRGRIVAGEQDGGADAHERGFGVPISPADRVAEVLVEPPLELAELAEMAQREQAEDPPRLQLEPRPGEGVLDVARLRRPEPLHAR